MSSDLASPRRLPKVTLKAWARLHFDPPPKLPTLRAWAASGLIVPAPIKVGRTWMVEQHAEYRPRTIQVEDENLSPRVRRILYDIKEKP